MENFEFKSYTTDEAPKVLIDKETGLEQVEFEKNGETTEIFLRTAEGKVLGYANLEEISKLENDERILQMMGIEISSSIMDLISNDKTKSKYYIKFLEKSGK